MATGFEFGFPFLPRPLATPRSLYLNMMHPTVPSLYFIGLFQPIGCIWRLADHQARIAALQITGRLRRSHQVEAWPGPAGKHRKTRSRRRDPAPRNGIEVDYRSFERQLRREIAVADPVEGGRCLARAPDPA
jgi:hypothetical protein